MAYPAIATPNGMIAPGLGNLVFHTLRPDRYDVLGLPIWTGRAVVVDGADMSDREVAVMR